MGRQLPNDLGLIAHDHIPLYQVLKLSYVPGPGVLHHSDLRVFAEGRRLLAIKVAVFLQEELEEHRYLFPPFAQRRNMNGNHVQPVEEILAKCAVLNRVFQRLVSGG